MKDTGIFVKEVWRGKTLHRTLQNLVLRQIGLSGKILGVAGGRDPSYKRFNLLGAAGFGSLKLIPYAGRFTSIADLLMPYLQWTRLFTPIALIARWLDKTSAKIASIETDHPAYCGYIVEATV